MTADEDTSADESITLPLAGRRILITRAPHQTSELADGLRALGAEVIPIPTIEIGPPSSFAALDAALASLRDFDLIAFTSANAVRAYAERRGTAKVTETTRIAVVGPATARAAEEIGLRVDIIPPQFTAQSLAHALLPQVRDRDILLVLAEDAPTTLAQALTAGGARVRIAAAYRNRIPENSLAKIVALLSDPARMPHAVTFTSASTANNLVALLKAAGMTLPGSVARISIGPITSKSLVELELPVHIEAAEATIPSLLEAVHRYLNYQR